MAAASLHPLISVILPTYNRSNCLRYSIASVIRSARTDWELIVVGDACTDDTRDVVESFRDPRISFVNLERNSGDQAAPNNEGFRRARGQYIAYLHHDDLWMPHHLDTALEGLLDSHADMVFTLGLIVSAHGPNALCGAVPGRSYSPVVAIPVSLWLVTREFLEDFGPWKRYQDCYLEPGQELLCRAWKAGQVIRLVSSVTVVKLQAGHRPNVYADRPFLENLRYWERMQSEPHFLQIELEKAALDEAAANLDLAVWRHVRRGLINVSKRAGQACGVTPLELAAWLTFRKRGGAIHRWRGFVGLD